MIDSLEFQLGLTAATFAQALIWAPLLGALALLIPDVIREHRRPVNRRRFSLRRFWLWEVSFRKIGGIYFLKVGRFGCSFWVSKRKK
jgi:hypothetical protein